MVSRIIAALAVLFLASSWRQGANIAPTAGPTINSQYLYVIDAGTGLALYQKGSLTDSLVPASLTKLTTGILLERYVSNQSATVTTLASDVLGGSSCLLNTGDVVTILQASQGMIVPSGNTCANMIGRTVGAVLCSCGDVNTQLAAFQTAQTALVAEFGMSGTVLTGPSGTDNENSSSITPKDTLNLLQRATAVSSLYNLMNITSFTMNVIGGPSPRSFSLSTPITLINSPCGAGKSGNPGVPVNTLHTILLCTVTGGHNVYLVLMQIIPTSRPNQDADANTVLTQIPSDFSWATGRPVYLH